MTKIVLICPITSRNCGLSIRDQPISKALSPSIQKLGLVDAFHLVMGYDRGDPVWDKKENRNRFNHLSIDWIELCGYSRKITSIWNYLEKEARKLDYDYLIPANDDLTFMTDPLPGIEVLKDRCDFGICGFHDYAFPGLSTFYFVGRTHIDIFGTLYPLKWEGAHQDSWISDVYRPWDASGVCREIEVHNRIGLTDARFIYGSAPHYRHVVWSDRRRVNDWLKNNPVVAPVLTDEQLLEASCLL